MREDYRNLNDRMNIEIQRYINHMEQLMASAEIEEAERNSLEEMLLYDRLQYNG